MSPIAIALHKHDSGVGLETSLHDAARRATMRCCHASHTCHLPSMPSFAHVNHVVIMVLGEAEKRVGMVCGSKQTKPQIIPTRSVTIVVVGCKKFLLPLAGQSFSGFQPWAFNSNSLLSRVTSIMPSSSRVMCPMSFTPSICSIFSWSPMGTVNSSS